jgi:hypothetical protein
MNTASRKQKRLLAAKKVLFSSHFFEPTIARK